MFASIVNEKIPSFNINDPVFNFQKIYQNLLLLEDHVEDVKLRCPNCICKHINTIRGYLSECRQLDIKQLYKDDIDKFEAYFNNSCKCYRDKDFQLFSQKIKNLRKDLSDRYGNRFI